MARWGVYSTKNSTWTVDSPPPPRFLESLYPKGWWRCKLMAEHNGDIFTIHTSYENPIICKLEQINGMWVEMEILGGMTLFAHYLCCQARTDIVGKMRNNIYFSKVRFMGDHVSRSLLMMADIILKSRYYDWSEGDPFRSIWIEASKDLLIFLSNNNGKIT